MGKTSETFRTAIIGCGRIAGGYDREVPSRWSATHAGAYHLCPDTTLVAVADPDSSARAQFQEKWGVTQGYSDYRELFAAESIDIVSLCLPTQEHPRAFAAAVQGAIPAVFCEKPLAPRLSEAEYMAGIGRECIVAVNYFRRWNPSLAHLANDIEKGRYGDLVQVVVRYTKGMLVNASHFMDLACWFWGEPEQVRFVQQASADNVDPGMDFVMTYPRAAVHFLHVPGIDYVFADVDILTTNGRIVIGQRGQKLLTWAQVDEPYYGLFKIIGEPQIVETEWRNCSTRAVQEIADCLGGGPSPRCGLAEGLTVSRICHAVQKQAGL